jgi:hypothetical protein
MAPTVSYREEEKVTGKLKSKLLYRDQNGD